MASAATEMDVEARIARLESDVSHIRSDLADVKLDVRALRARLDEVSDRHTDGLNALDAKLTARIDTLQRDLASAKVWALLLYITLAGAMYATLGRTMGWI